MSLMITHPTDLDYMASRAKLQRDLDAVDTQINAMTSTLHQLQTTIDALFFYYEEGRILEDVKRETYVLLRAKRVDAARMQESINHLTLQAVTLEDAIGMREATHEP